MLASRWMEEWQRMMAASGELASGWKKAVKYGLEGVEGEKLEGVGGHDGSWQSWLMGVVVMTGRSIQVSSIQVSESGRFATKMVRGLRGKVIQVRELKGLMWKVLEEQLGVAWYVVPREQLGDFCET